jgi:hypothetical protein
VKTFLGAVLQNFLGPFYVSLSHTHSLKIALFALLSLGLSLGGFSLCPLLDSLALGGRLLLRNDPRSLAVSSLPLGRPLGGSAAPPTARSPLGRLPLGSFHGGGSGVLCLDRATILLRQSLKALSPPLRSGLICWGKDNFGSGVAKRPLLFFVRDSQLLWRVGMKWLLWRL